MTRDLTYASFPSPPNWYKDDDVSIDPSGDCAVWQRECMHHGNCHASSKASETPLQLENSAGIE